MANDYGRFRVQESMTSGQNHKFHSRRHHRPSSHQPIQHQPPRTRLKNDLPSSRHHGIGMRIPRKCSSPPTLCVVNGLANG